MTTSKLPPPQIVRASDPAGHGARTGRTAVGPLGAYERMAAGLPPKPEPGLQPTRPLFSLAGLLDRSTLAKVMGEPLLEAAERALRSVAPGAATSSEAPADAAPCAPSYAVAPPPSGPHATAYPAEAYTEAERRAPVSPSQSPAMPQEQATMASRAAMAPPQPVPVAPCPPLPMTAPAVQPASTPAPLSPAHGAAVTGGRGPVVAVAAPAPAPTAHPTRVDGPAPARAPDTSLFRYEALRAYKLGLKLTAPLRVVPLHTGLVVGTLAAVLLGVLVIMSFGKVDLTARGRGVIRATEGVQPLLFEVEGVVRELLVRDGDVVRPGQVLARLDSTRLSAALQEAEEQLRTVEEHNRSDQAHADVAYERDVQLIKRRAQLARERIVSQEASVAAHVRERGRYASLADEGLVAEKSRREAEELLHQERRNLLILQGELAQLEQQLTELESSHRTATSLRAQQEREARNRRDVSRLLLAQTELRASRAGRIESLLVNEGDVIGAGRVVARLVSLQTGRQITAFLPERERAFVHPGAPVRIEFDQLPVGEFGGASASVVRVSSEVAGTPEIERALGAAAPEGVHFAVALELRDDTATRALYERVASGSLVTVRMPVRQRRIISLVFDPVRKWLD